MNNLDSKIGNEAYYALNSDNKPIKLKGTTDKNAYLIQTLPLDIINDLFKTK